MASDIYTQSPFLVRKAAYLYYMEHKSQQEIANGLNISVTTVSRLIKKAKEEQIVKYEIDHSCIACMELAAKLREAYHLKDVVIAPKPGREGGYGTPPERRRIVALEGARYLQRIIREKDVLGISWGRIVCDMLLYLNPSHKIDTKFVTLHGMLGSCIRQELRELVLGMAKAFSGQNYYLPSKALAPSAQAAQKVKSHPGTKKVYEMFRSVNISIAGIGTWYPEPKTILVENGFLSEKEQQVLLQNGVVGDVGLRFFDKNGMECQTELSDRLIAIELNQFKKIERKITLAAGLEKAFSVYYALNGGLIDVLIADEELARRLLDLSNGE